MSTIVTRAGKGSPLTNTEVDANFTNLNTDKAELSGATFTGTVTANAGVVVDNFTLDGTTLALSSGDMTLDAAGDIILDADGADVILKDGGTSFLEIDKDGDNARLKNPIADGDIKIQGIDGASTITALTLDMSEGGDATFSKDLLLLGDNHNLRIGADQDLMFFFDGNNAVMRNITSDSDILFKGSDGGSPITALTLDMSDGGTASFNSHIRL